MNNCVYNDGMALKVKRYNISMYPEDMKLIDLMSAELHMNRSQFLIWLTRGTSAFFSAPDIDEEFIKQMKKHGFEEVKEKRGGSRVKKK